MDRKEAIEVVRKKVGYYEADKRLKAALEALIPELSESEDEKNWKAVLGYVKDDALRVWLEKQKEQKPIPALDRGDEIILKAIREELKDSPGWVERIEGWYRLAKDAQQPAEWSEEDEKMRESAISFVQAVNSCRYILGVDKHDVINWLKSLRPQPKWKPSGEQLLALKRAIEEVEKIDSNTASTLALLKFDLQNS